MPIYRKKPVEIEARQYNGTPEANREIIDWTRGTKTPAYMEKIDGVESLCISTLEGDYKVSKFDYVIKGIKGEFYPCKPNIFEATYEMVSK